MNVDVEEIPTFLKRKIANKLNGPFPIRENFENGKVISTVRRSIVTSVKL